MSDAAMRTAPAPVVEALLAHARARAEALLAGARADARVVVAEAQARADAILAQARADGEAAAERSANAVLASARREARGAVLAAQRRAYDAARAGALAALEQRVTTPEAAALAVRLTEVVRARLGTGAIVRAAGGSQIGVVADRGNRHIDLTTETLLDSAVAALGPRISALWT